MADSLAIPLGDNRNLYKAAALLARGYEPAGISKVDGGYHVWFSQTYYLQRDAESYDARLLEANIARFSWFRTRLLDIRNGKRPCCLDSLRSKASGRRNAQGGEQRVTG